jgi:topoisomerase-4 subunit B
MSDLFQTSAARQSDYSAKDIEVLEGLEPVRRRPGMYIGGTDERALHHLVAEVLDNAMDEAVAGHANRIDLTLSEDGSVTIRDNGRGIPIDAHPKFTDRSALEVIFTTLHSGGKFSGDSYKTAGGLHGVGISVVNALSDRLEVEVARDRKLWGQSYSRGLALGPLREIGLAPNRRGTQVKFHPDPQIFGEEARFKAATLYRLARSKAYLFRGVEIRWAVEPGVPRPADIPEQETLHFPGGLSDYLASQTEGKALVIPEAFAGMRDFSNAVGRAEWAIAWLAEEDGWVSTYCNTVPTPLGGTHENGLRSAVLRSLKGYGEMTGNRRAAQIVAEDFMGGAIILLSVFIADPQFQGQTKERLVSAEAARLVEGLLKDSFDHFLTANPGQTQLLIDHLIDRAEERLKRRANKEMDRKSATRKLRLPGKLTDCARSTPEGTEVFLVEGDSAGGSAKQARDREFQAVLPLRGKILNVANATREKLGQNQELKDLVLALGAGSGDRYDDSKLRYERVIIMTDADVDGAHIAALLMTFFYREMPGLIAGGHLYLAQPPLYRIAQGATSIYAQDDAEKERLLRTKFKGKGKIEISRFKGLGEMPPMQLRETTMSPSKRTLLRVKIGRDGEEDDGKNRTALLIEQLMGRKPEHRFSFIQENAKFARDLDV